MVYSLQEISDRVAPIAEAYSIPQVYVFGSYARGDATEESDLDFLMELRGSDIKGLWDLGGLYVDLEQSLGKGVDVVSLAGLEHPERVEMDPQFADAVRREMVQVYAREG